MHLTENEMPDNKKLLKKSTDFDKFRGHIIACQPLAPPINRIAVAAVIKEWKKSTSNKMLAGWMVREVLVYYTQAIERHHQKVDKDILEALREENHAARLPAVTDVIRAIFYKCLRL